ncbi:MAG: ComEC/Rec2 family competence protein [Acidobacteriota bacterium]|nr:ComEC/Rec2 family competence protein [Acidobacteriota bacterium]
MIPLLWIAASLALGIALAGALPPAPVAWLAVAVAAVAGGWLLARRGRLWTAWAIALIAWCFVGIAAVSCEHAARPVNRVDRMVDAGRIDLSEPLRWQGRLRDDPLRLPWGYRYIISLEQVEIGGRMIPVSGGLRLNFYTDREHVETPPAVRAGDTVEVLAKAREPGDFLDPGSFDYRGYLVNQGIELTGTLRSAELLRKQPGPPPAFAERVARLRGAMRREADGLFDPREAPVIRAMLLGDRSFVDTTLAQSFQKAGSYHVLVIAGLHVAVLTLALFWLCRKLHLSPGATTFVILAALAAYVTVVEDRPPVERAALMAAVVLLARLFYRRVSLLNSVSLAAIVLLLARPADLADSSFQLSFLAAAIIAAVGMPWIDRTCAPYRRGIEHLGDPTRDGAHPPRVIQLRLDLRAAMGWLSSHLPERPASAARKALEWAMWGGFYVWELALLSFAIQLGLLPIIVADFYRVSISGPVANVPAVVLTTLIVPLGFLALGVGLLWQRLGVLIAKPVGWLVALLVDSVRWFAGWRWLSYRIPGPPLWLLVAFLALLTILGAALYVPGGWSAADPHMRRRLPRWVKWSLGGGLVAATLAVATYPFPPSLRRGKLEVTVLDVGQGDSIFVAFPDGRTLLVDGGGLEGSFTAGGYNSGLDVGEDVVSPYLWSRGLKRVDAVELTHAHHDHMGGLFAVLENFRVGQLWVGHDVDSRAYHALLAEARSRGISILHRRSGESFDWGGVDGRFLWPSNDDEVAKASNNDSIVLSLTDGQTRFLLPGDIEKKVESELVSGNDPITSVFLKVPHHGSKTSSTQEFLEAVHPRYAVMSVGTQNAFGLPSAQVVDRYREDGIDLWSTERDGAVTALSNGARMTIDPYVHAGR